MFTLARRNGIRLPYASVEAVRQAYRFRNLQDFLDIYYQGMSVLITEQDFYDLAWAYLERAHADNVRHVEMFFDPQGHTSRGIPFATVIEGLSRAIADAGRTLGIKASLIMCFLRHLDEADAERTLDSALPFKDRIVGVGLDSSERGNPPGKFKHVFRRAREAGFFLTAHAGEEGPPSYVWEALDALGVARIDHGVRSIEDEPLVDRLDFGGYVKENYRASAQALGLGRDEVAALVRNGINASLMAEPDKATLLAEVARVLAGTM